MEKINKKLKVYELVISDLPDESGVDYVAMVDDPAIEDHGKWIMFEKQTQFVFKATEPDKQIISGFIMLADTPIYRRDEVRGEYYVSFPKSTNEAILKKFAKNNYFNNVNIMHDETAKVPGVYMIELFMIDSARGVNTPNGFDKAPDGSIYASYYVENKKIWDEFIKTGIFKGFSVEGMFGYSTDSVKQAKDFSQIIDEFISILK